MSFWFHAFLKEGGEMQIQILVNKRLEKTPGFQQKEAIDVGGTLTMYDI